MNRNLREQYNLEEVAGAPARRRPLIGVPTGREKSQRFFGLPLYIMNQTYVRVLENLGALPIMIPLQMTEQTLRGIFERLDGLFLPGGEDIDPAAYGEERHPQLGSTDVERDRTEMLLTRWALEQGMPLLGVCRGVQVMNVVLGGSLWQDLTAQADHLYKHDYFPPTYERFRISHPIAIEPDSRLAHALGAVNEVNSMHHQGIRAVGAGLRVVGRAQDGLPEALEVPDLPFALGVQWHPEELAKTDDGSAGIFHDFIHVAAGDWRADVPADWRAHFHTLPQGRIPNATAWSPATVAAPNGAPVADLRANCA